MSLVNSMELFNECISELNGLRTKLSSFTASNMRINHPFVYTNEEKRGPGGEVKFVSIEQDQLHTTRVSSQVVSDELMLSLNREYIETYLKVAIVEQRTYDFGSIVDDYVSTHPVLFTLNGEISETDRLGWTVIDSGRVSKLKIEEMLRNRLI